MPWLESNTKWTQLVQRKFNSQPMYYLPQLLLTSWPILLHSSSEKNLILSYFRHETAKKIWAITENCCKRKNGCCNKRNIVCVARYVHGFGQIPWSNKKCSSLNTYHWIFSLQCGGFLMIICLYILQFLVLKLKVVETQKY